MSNYELKGLSFRLKCRNLQKVREIPVCTGMTLKFRNSILYIRPARCTRLFGLKFSHLVISLTCYEASAIIVLILVNRKGGHYYENSLPLRGKNEVKRTC
jgi:hypothetical protein